MHSPFLLKRSLGLALGLVGSIAAAQEVVGTVPDTAIPVLAPLAVQRSVVLGHTDPAKVLHISVSLPYGDEAGLQSFVDAVNDPKSPYYHQYLTPQEVGERYGLSTAAVQRVQSYLQSKGFKIKSVAKNRLTIQADATVTQAEAAFGTKINDYQSIAPEDAGNSRFFAQAGPIKVPMAIASDVLDVSGLESFTKPKPLSVLSPTQTRTLYGLATIYNNGRHGEGRTVGISNWDGFKLSNVAPFYSQFGLPTPAGGVGSNITVVTISGGAQNGSAGGEGDLDIQMVLGQAPLCNFRIYDGGASDLIGVLSAEVNDNQCDVISESYGWSLGSTTATSAHNLHLSMSAQGITYMAASGDSGTSLEPYSYPDYDPEVLMVGGTAASVDSSGNRLSEVGWNGSGGGWSTNTVSFNVLPSWQRATGLPTTTNKRLVPDVAFHASGTQTSTQGAYYFYYNGSLNSGSIGTSFASPVFAGGLAVAEQQIIAQGGLPANGAGKQRFGRIQDLLYSQNMRSDVWLDITSGANGNLPSGTASTAKAGWDFVTGLGVINWNAFVATQVGQSSDFTVSATPSSQTVIAGNGTTYTANTGVVNGFSGSVSFSVSGLPSGASASFNPASVTAGNGSTLSVSTSSSTPAGSYTLTISGTSGSTTHSTTVTLVVNSAATGDFTISVSPSSQSIRRGGAVTYTVTVSGVNGFAGTVALSQSGAPGTASFSPSSVAGQGTSSLKVQTARNSTRKTYTITVTGTSGSLTHTATATLTVQ